MCFLFSQFWQRARSWYSSLKFGLRDTWTETQEVTREGGWNGADLGTAVKLLYVQSWRGRTPWGRRSWWKNEPAEAKLAESLGTRSEPSTEACKRRTPSHSELFQVHLYDYCCIHPHQSGTTKIWSAPEILHMVLDSSEVQAVSQGLVVDQSLRGWTPVHICRGATNRGNRLAALSWDGWALNGFNFRWVSHRWCENRDEWGQHQ